jgi:hypothetical protein
MKKIKLISLVLLSSLLSLNAQKTMVIQPNSLNGKDAFINQLLPSTNYGNHEDFISYYWTFSGNPGKGNSLIQFDLSSIPANSEIISAKLSLFYNSKSSSGGQAGNNACYLKKITSAWSESAVTWNSVPSTDTTNEVFLPKSTAINEDYPNIDITHFVQEWYDKPSSNFGLMLELIDNSLYNSMKFFSSDYSDTTKTPKIVVCFKSTVGITNIKNNSRILIYPNPASNEIIIESNNLSNEDIFVISNLNGQELTRQQIKKYKSTIDISNLPSGIFFVTVISDKAIEVKKIIKE